MISLKWKDLIFLISVSIAIAAVCSCLLCVFSNTPNHFTEIIMGGAASYNLNRNNEGLIICIGAVVGIVLLSAFVCLHNTSQREKFQSSLSGEKIAQTQTTKEEKFKLVLIFFISSFFSNGLIYSKWNPTLMILAVALVFFWFDRRAKIWECLILCLLCHLNVIVIAITLAFVGININATVIPYISIVLVIFLILLSPKRFLRREILILQIPLSLLLLVFLKNRYNYNGQIITLPLPLAYRLIFVGTMLWAVVSALCNAVRNWNYIPNSDLTHGDHFRALITISSSVCVMLFFSGFQAYYLYINQLIAVDSKDFTENLQGFSQLLLGNRFYVDYFPVQGLFPVSHGAVLELFGGTLECIPLATTTVRCIFFVLFILVVRNLFSMDILFLVAYLVKLHPYDRPYAVFLGFFLLFSPKLLSKKNLWLKIWIWVCFLAGLYYPMQGVALLVCTVPIGIKQAFTYIRSDSFLQDFKKKSFIPAWLICLCPIFLSLPLLWRLAKHMLVYADNATLANIPPPLLAKTVNFKEFLCFLPIGNDIKQMLFYFLYFFVILLMLFISWLYFLKALKSEQQQDRNMVVFLSIALFLLGVVGLWSAWTRGVGSYNMSSIGRCIPYFAVVLLIFTVRYVRYDNSKLMLFAIVAALVSLLGFVSTENNGNNLAFKTEYEVPEGYILIPEDNPFPRLGKFGFIDSTFYGRLEGYQSKIQKLQSVSPDISLYGIEKFSYSTLFALDLPVYGQLTQKEIRTYSTWNQLKDVLERKRPAIGQTVAKSSYHIYRWLLSTDEYRFSHEYDLFLPVEVYESLGLSKKESENLYAVSFANSDLNTQQMANAFGRSIDSLQDTLTFSPTEINWKKESVHSSNAKDPEKNIISSQFSLVPEETVDGSIYDFLYVKFSGEVDIRYEGSRLEIFSGIAKRNDSMVSVSWPNPATGQNTSVKCILGTGELLIPLGLNQTWLLSEHDELTILVQGRDVNIEEICFAGLSVM